MALATLLAQLTAPASTCSISFAAEMHRLQDQMEQMVEMFVVVMTRLRLADDSFSNAILQLLDVQM